MIVRYFVNRASEKYSWPFFEHGVCPKNTVKTATVLLAQGRLFALFCHRLFLFSRKRYHLIITLAASSAESLKQRSCVCHSVCLSVSVPFLSNFCVKKGKVFPYSLPSVGPGADPGVQAVSPQVTWSESCHRPSSRLPLLSARPAVTSVAFTRWRYL